MINGEVSFLRLEDDKAYIVMKKALIKCRFFSQKEDYSRYFT